MATKIVYPLLEVLNIKRKRVDEAYKVLQQKRKELQDEQNKLLEVEAARDKVLHHRNDKLQQLYDTLEDITTSDEIYRMKIYLEVVEEKLQAEQEKVKKQQENVQLAEKNLRVAEDEWRNKRREVEKLETHQEQWTKQMKKELAEQEAKEQEELGSTMFISKRMKNR